MHFDAPAAIFCHLKETTHMLVKVLELFAGIGGQALALKSAGIKTMAYCEISPWNRAVLESNMLRGRLHAAATRATRNGAGGRDRRRKGGEPRSHGTPTLPAKNQTSDNHQVPCRGK